MRYAIGWMVMIVSLLLIGCPDSYTPERKPPAEDMPPFLWGDELFVSEDVGGGLTRTVFRTNDKQYWTYEGMTMWTVWGDGEDIFDSRTVTMGKSTGYSGGGYGIVFCHGEYEVEEKLTLAMLVVMVNNEGQYIIGKAIGGIFNDIGWWKSTPYLHRGTGATNELTMSYEKENGEYCLTINGYEIERFRDDSAPALRKGKNGYIAVITPFDKFPESGIDVYYLEKM